MNIWSLRKKQKAAETQSAEKRPSAPANQTPAVETPAVPPVEKICAPKAETVEQPISGLNDLFDMTDNDIRKLSPTGNFSKLKSPRPKQASEQRAIETENIDKPSAIPSSEQKAIETPAAQCDATRATEADNAEQPVPGLNDLFDMTDNDIRKLSPTGNFSKLKSSRKQGKPPKSVD